jgi:ABC-type Mn2+/Zn2+ transport system permease subunit
MIAAGVPVRIASGVGATPALLRRESLVADAIACRSCGGTSVLGVVMVLALLFIPASVVLPWAGTIPTAMALAAVVGITLVNAGFMLANHMAWPLSQTIGAVGFVLVAPSHLLMFL